MSGHSKWTQIKHKKAVTDARRGQLFSKTVKEITVATRTGGSSLDSNSRLRTAVERAKSAGLPKENIERAIEKGLGGSGAGEEFHEFLYEAVAGNVAILIEGITDNKNRTLAEVRHTLVENGARLADQGSLLWNFDKIGLIKIAEGDNPEKSREDIEMAIIDSGANDFKRIDDGWFVETSFSQLESVRQKLEKTGIKLKEVSHDYKAKTGIEIEFNAKNSLETLLDKLLEQNDVQEVYTNLNE